jgi:tRNA(fMet)-specific endonuclease VapC
MRYLLDTNIVIFVLKEPTGHLAKRIAQMPNSDVAVCSIVEAELHYGATKYGVPHRRIAALDGFLAPFRSLAFDSMCVTYYARIRSDLERHGRVIGGNDMLIAAIALANDLTVVTHNSGEFGRVTGLKVEDWTTLTP